MIAPQEHPRWLAPLQSGARVLVLEDHSAPVVSTVAVYGAGGSSDPAGREGLAHFVEHLAFRSRPGGGPQMWDYLKRMGATFNAYTTSDLTVYYASAHRDNLPRLMQLEAWRLARTLDGVTAEALAAEKGVVHNERRQRSETTIGNRPFELVMQALFPPGHPLARPVSGTSESLESTTLADARAFVKRHYRPQNFTLVIAGDVDDAQVSRLVGMWPVEILFGPGGPDGPTVAPARPIGARAAPALPPPHRPALQRHRGPFTQPELLLAWSLPPGFRGDGALIRLTAARLEHALSEGLDVRRDRSIERTRAHGLELADGSVLILQAWLQPGADPEWVRSRLLDIVADSQTWTGVQAAAQTAASRWHAATSLLLTSVESLTKGLALAEHLATTGNATYFQDHFRELAAIAPRRIDDLAARFVTRERAVALHFEPESDQIPSVARGSTGAPAAAGAPEAAAALVGRAEHELASEGVQRAEDLSADRIRETVLSPGLGRLPRFRLPNGLEVFVIPRAAAPIAQIELGLRGGDASLRPVGLARLASGLHPASCREHGSLIPVGGRIVGLHGLTESETFVRVFSGNLANGLAVLSDSVICRRADDEALLDLPARLRVLHQQWQRAGNRPEQVAGKKLWGALYPDHPFGEAGFVDPLVLADAGGDQARAFVYSHFRPDNAVAVVHGDVDPRQVEALAGRYLQRWSGASPPALAMAAPPPPPPPARRTLFLIDRPGASQATLSLACRLADARPELRPAYDVLEQVAGSLTWSLRESWGASYGVHAQVEVMPGNAAHLLLAGTVDRAAVLRSTNRLLAIVREIATGALDPRRFAAQRWEVGRAFMSRFALASVQASAIRSAFHHRWPLTVWDQYPEHLAATTPQVLQTLMASCLDREVLAIVGDAATLRPQLAAAGFELDSPLARR